MFKAALFTIAKTWGQPRCPPDKWIKKMWCIYTMECCCLVSESSLTLLWPHGLRSVKLLCPWDFPGKNTGGNGLVAKWCPSLATPWTTVACQAPLPIGFSQQDYWSGLPFPSPGESSPPGIKSSSLALAGILCCSATREAWQWNTTQP